MILLIYTMTRVVIFYSKTETFIQCQFLYVYLISQKVPNLMKSKSYFRASLDEQCEYKDPMMSIERIRRLGSICDVHSKWALEPGRTKASTVYFIFIITYVSYLYRIHTLSIFIEMSYFN